MPLYVAEQWSSFLPVVHQIRQFRPRGRLLQRRRSRLSAAVPVPALDRRARPAAVVLLRAVPAALLSGWTACTR